ncbi:hypothetical protein ACJX0J_039826, partial [Zea mays]
CKNMFLIMQSLLKNVAHIGLFALNFKVMLYHSHYSLVMVGKILYCKNMFLNVADGVAGLCFLKQITLTGYIWSDICVVIILLKAAWALTNIVVIDHVFTFLIAFLNNKIQAIIEAGVLKNRNEAAFVVVTLYAFFLFAIIPHCHSDILPCIFEAQAHTYYYLMMISLHGTSMRIIAESDIVLPSLL